MKRAVFLLILLSLQFVAAARPGSFRDADKVNVAVTSVSRGPDRMEIIFNCGIEEGWHIHAPEDSPLVIPTSFVVDSISGAKLTGPIEADRPAVEEYSPAFGCILSYYSGSVTFVQKVSLLSEHYYLKGHLLYQACSDVSCLMPSSLDVVLTDKKTEVPQPAVTERNP